MIGESKKYLGMEISNGTSANTTVFDVVEKKLIGMKEIQSGVEFRINHVK
jgi:hypothetical protein